MYKAREIFERATNNTMHPLADQVVAYGAAPGNLHYEVSMGYHGTREDGTPIELWILSVVEEKDDRPRWRLELTNGFFDVDSLWEHLDRLRWEGAP